MSDLGYGVRERRLAFETDLFQVFSDTIVDKHDKILAPNYLVVTPRNRTEEGITGIAVVPFVRGKVGLLQVFRHAVQASGWEVPRGFIDKGEAPEEAALRELSEESGLLCEVDNLFNLGSLAPDPGILDARIQCFVARNCSFSKGGREAEFGHRDFRFFSAPEVEQLIRDGGVQDSVSLAAYFMIRSRIYKA